MKLRFSADMTMNILQSATRKNAVLIQE